MWELTSVFPETHIFYRELLCARGPLEGTIMISDVTGCSVLNSSEEIIKTIRIIFPVACMYGDYNRVHLVQQ